MTTLLAPDEILLLDPLPMNPTGKVARRALPEKLAPAEASQGWQSEFERIAHGARIHGGQGGRGRSSSIRSTPPEDPPS